MKVRSSPIEYVQFGEKDRVTEKRLRSRALRKDVRQASGNIARIGECVKCFGLECPKSETFAVSPFRIGHPSGPRMRCKCELRLCPIGRVPKPFATAQIRRPHLAFRPGSGKPKGSFFRNRDHLAPHSGRYSNFGTEFDQRNGVLGRARTIRITTAVALG